MSPSLAITEVRVSTVEREVAAATVTEAGERHRSREGWSAGTEGTDRSTSCATVYNAGNTICRNLLPLDTRSSPRPRWRISFLDRAEHCARICRSLSSFRQMRKTIPTRSSLLLARALHSRVYTTRPLCLHIIGWAFLFLSLFLFPFSFCLRKISSIDESFG